MKLKNYINENVKKPQLLKDLMDIHMLLDEPKTYLPIRGHIENLENNYSNDKNYKELQRISVIMLRVLKEFSQSKI